MSLLYQEEFDHAPSLCFNCARIFRSEPVADLQCPECSYQISRKRYEDFYRYAFYAARYGIQYRSYYEGSEPPYAKPMLANLGELGAFVAIAAISGVIGNAAWDAVKHAIVKVLAQRESCRDHHRLKFGPEDVEKLIEYVVEYDRGFKSLPESIQSNLMEEIIGDAAAENEVLSKRLLELTMTEGERSPEQKRQAVLLYRELVRRSMARSAKRPSRASGSFWTRANS